jgi:hypothetical protein
MEAIVTPLGLSGNVTRAGQASHHGFLLQPAGELAPNKSKEMQVKPRKKACISLLFLGGIGRFQWVTGEKIKKFSLSMLASQVVGEVLKFDFLAFLSPPGVARSRILQVGTV